jgi:hypothetical protein
MHLSAKVVGPGSAMRTPALARQTRMSSTGAHVWINKDTKVICQGLTGKAVLRLISSMDGGDIVVRQIGPGDGAGGRGYRTE